MRRSRLSSLRRERRPRLEIVPMIDVMFFLLVFYILGSLSLSRARVLPLQLPGAQTGEALSAAPRQRALDLSVTRDGGYALDGRSLTLPQLATALQREARRESSPSGTSRMTLRVAADARSPHGAVVAALDAAREVGLSRFAIVTRPATRVTSPTSP